MDADKRKALEAAGWKVGSADEFLGERPMSDSDKIRAEFEAEANAENYLTVKTTSGEYVDRDTEAAWHFFQRGYAAGRKAEKETIRKLISPQVVAPLIKLSERVDEALKRSKPEGER